MTYDFGDVLVVEFPFTDGSRSKRRPAVVVSAPDYIQRRGDVILMAVTSQTGPADGELEALVLEWRGAGLAKPSALKPVVFTLDKQFIRAKVGALGVDDIARLRALLARIIG